jgi:uncharacterized protein YndB with AHSA1/START domain
MMIEPIRLEVATPLPVARAFERFAGELHDWWPREYTWSQAVLQQIGIEPRVDGLCFEIGPHGFRCDWGRVVEWAPPDRLRLAWQISPRREPVPDPEQASSVTVSFAAQGPQRTKVSLVHDAFERHGNDGAGYRDAMASARGWPFILQRFVEAAVGDHLA